MNVGEADLATLSACDRWYQTAFSEIDSICLSIDSPGLAVFQSPRFPGQPISLLHGETSYLIAHALAQWPALDASPVQKIYDAINAWHNDQSAERLPPKLHLQELFDKANTVLTVIRNDILGRAKQRDLASYKKESTNRVAVREVRPPYSALHQLWGWGARLRSLLDDEGYQPQSMDWTIFRPCSDSRNSMMKFSVKYPLVIKPISDALDAAEACFEAFCEDGCAVYTDAARGFAEAENVLLERIETAVEIIKETETPGTAAKAEPAAHAIGKPSWNKDTGELSFNGSVVKSVRNLGPAKNIVAILNAFETDSWRIRIDDPLPFERRDAIASRRLRETIRSLNTGLHAICFSADGTGKGIRWEVTSVI